MRKKSEPAPLSAPIFVLVGPFADPKTLSKWAHEEFRKSAMVAFIGVDAGFEPLVASGLPATLLIGDLDGIADPEMASMTPTIQLPTGKERSDLSFALNFCVKQKAEHLYAYGFQGGRSDHEFAVHLDLAVASERIARVVSLGERGVTVYVSAKYTGSKTPLSLAQDDLVRLRDSFAPRIRLTKKSDRKNKKAAVHPTDWISLFPVSGPAKGVRAQGLRFPVRDGVLSSSSQGLSNEFRAKKMKLELRQGKIAVFFPARC
ncbi:MAG: hypothetical protein H7301_04025 [Cryobacterium sp.]|nr:hypothetical protein [Oligoflexia bacterium]